MPPVLVSYILLDMSEHPTHNPTKENPDSSDSGDSVAGIYTVTEISTLIKQVIEDEFPYVRIRGEVTGFTRAHSGHLYFSLKDEGATLDAVCWKGTAGRLATKPEDGLEIIATGRLSTYGPRSRYQLVVDAVEVAGEGALLKLLEDRKKMLAREGLFDEDRKRDIPYLPTVIGVVTSPTGAVIRDILHRIKDRFPLHVVVWPVRVQGKEAASEIATAIEGFNALPLSTQKGGKIPRPDVLIIARGGGSLEDLWAFNEETVVRAAAASEIPLISAVGHETDTTLIDFAADLRAPTPTAAAEMAVPVKSELLAEVTEVGARLVRAAVRLTGGHQQHLKGLARGLPDLAGRLGTNHQRLDGATRRLDASLKAGVARRYQRLAEQSEHIRSPKALLGYGRERLEGRWAQLGRASVRFNRVLGARIVNAGRLLDGLSYERVLERGFALVTDGEGAPVIRAAVLGAGDEVAMRFSDGAVSAQVTGTGQRPKPRPKKTTRKPDGRQGELL